MVVPRVVLSENISKASEANGAPPAAAAHDANPLKLAAKSFEDSVSLLILLLILCGSAAHDSLSSCAVTASLIIMLLPNCPVIFT